MLALAADHSNRIMSRLLRQAYRRKAPALATIERASMDAYVRPSEEAVKASVARPTEGGKAQAKEEAEVANYSDNFSSINRYPGLRPTDDSRFRNPAERLELSPELQARGVDSRNELVLWSLAAVFLINLKNG